MPISKGKKSNSSHRWLQEHFNDFYVKQSKIDGYRSRAVYKLIEIDDKERLIAPGMSIVDLGAAPGSWTQYVVEKIQNKGKILAVDCLPMSPMDNVNIICGDFTQDEVLEKIMELLPKNSADVVLSDMAPNLSGHIAVDIPKAMLLSELAFDFAKIALKPGGSLLVKIFHGAGCEELIRDIRKSFKKVSIKKPRASRSRSREVYLLARGYTL